MSNYLPNHVNNYTVYSPQLSDARVVQVQHRAFSSNWHGAQLLIAGMLVSSLIVATSHLVQLRSSALAPVSQPAVTVSSVQPPKDPQRSTSAVSPNPVATTTSKPQPDSSALQAVLNKWQSDYPAGKFGIVVNELSSPARSASLNPDNKFEMASLYKLYLADYIYNAVAKGTLSLSSTLGMNTTIASCMKPLIVLSDNACGEGMGYGLGWPRLNSFAHVAGFGETTLSPTNTTTASDMAKYLQQLQAGTLINSSDFSQQLLANMKVQIFRSAIPAGVPSVAVADKVGFNENYYHDVAIVYGPKSTYALVVLSQNSSSSAIKDLSIRVADFFNQ